MIIGTNKHEAALFKWMKSPLMPITPEAIDAMFTEIAAEQPTLQLPTEDTIGTTYAGLRGKARGMGVARDIGFRMPSVWLAEGHSAVAPVYLYRFDFATPMLKLLRIAAAHATELPFVWGNLVTGPKDPTFKLGGLKTGAAVSERIRARWLNFAIQAKPAGLPGEPEWPPYQESDRAACSSTGRTPSPRHRHAYPRHLGHRGAQFPVARTGLARTLAEVTLWTGQRHAEHVLPPLMRDPVTFAVPFFLVLLSSSGPPRASSRTPSRGAAPSGAYLKPRCVGQHLDGRVSIGTSAVMNGIALIGYAALYVYVAPWQLPATAWYTWVIAIVGVDLL